MNQPVSAIFHPPFNDIGKRGDQQSAQNDGTQQTNNQCPRAVFRTYTNQIARINKVIVYIPLPDKIEQSAK